MPRGVLSLSVMAICGLLLWLAYRYAPSGDFAQVGVWYSVAPPLLAMALAFITRKLAVSLGLALFLCGLLLGVARGEGALDAVFQGLQFVAGALWNVVSDPWSWRVTIFVILILIMSSIIILAGGLMGIARRLESYARGPRSTQAVTALLGVIIFIDDYASTMITGAAMRPMTDRWRISREKLAFLVDATSAPIAGLAVVSTWIAFEVGLFERAAQDLGLGLNGYEMFFDAIPYRFYCLFLLIFIAFNITSQRDFGAMGRAERRARTTGKLIADGAQPLTSTTYALEQAHPGVEARARTATLPLALMIVVFIGGIWLTGGGYTRFAADASTLWGLDAWRATLAHSNNSVALLSATGVGLAAAIYLALRVARLPQAQLLRAARGGARNALLPMGILVLAWALKQGFDALHLGGFLLHAIGGLAEPMWYPMLVFALAALISFGIGTSWGTMSLLIPIVVPLAYALDGQHYGLITIICLGAVLDGAIFGDHCSPVSDTTMMSSIASACDHVDHVTTQLPYSLAVAAIAFFCGYLPAASGWPLWTSWALAIGAIFSLFALLDKTPAHAAAVSAPRIPERTALKDP